MVSSWWPTHASSTLPSQHSHHSSRGPPAVCRMVARVLSPPEPAVSRSTICREVVARSLVAATAAAIGSSHRLSAPPRGRTVVSLAQPQSPSEQSPPSSRAIRCGSTHYRAKCALHGVGDLCAHRRVTVSAIRSRSVRAAGPSSRPDGEDPVLGRCCGVCGAISGSSFGWSVQYPVAQLIARCAASEVPNRPIGVPSAAVEIVVVAPIAYSCSPRTAHSPGSSRAGWPPLVMAAAM